MCGQAQRVPLRPKAGQVYGRGRGDLANLRSAAKERFVPPV